MSPSGMTRPKTLRIFHTVRVKAQRLAPSRACSRRLAALGLERLNQAHHPTTLGEAMSLVWYRWLGLWLCHWPSLGLVWGSSGHPMLAVAQLPSKQLETLALAYFKGYTHQQIADSLNEPLGTVKTRIRLAMKKLRLALQDQVSD